VPAEVVLYGHQGIVRLGVLSAFAIIIKNKIIKITGWRRADPLKTSTQEGFESHTL